jgi:hypothetical protein
MFAWTALDGLSYAITFATNTYFYNLIEKYASNVDSNIKNDATEEQQKSGPEPNSDDAKAIELKKQHTVDATIPELWTVRIAFDIESERPNQFNDNTTSTLLDELLSVQGRVVPDVGTLAEDSYLLIAVEPNARHEKLVVVLPSYVEDANVANLSESLKAVLPHNVEVRQYAKGAYDRFSKDTKVLSASLGLLDKDDKERLKIKLMPLFVSFARRANFEKETNAETVVDDDSGKTAIDTAHHMLVSMNPLLKSKPGYDIGWVKKIREHVIREMGGPDRNESAKNLVTIMRDFFDRVCKVDFKSIAKFKNEALSDWFGSLVSDANAVWDTVATTVWYANLAASAACVAYYMDNNVITAMAIGLACHVCSDLALGAATFVMKTVVSPMLSKESPTQKKDGDVERSDNYRFRKTNDSGSKIRSAMDEIERIVEFSESVVVGKTKENAEENAKFKEGRFFTSVFLSNRVVSESSHALLNKLASFSNLFWAQRVLLLDVVPTVVQFCAFVSGFLEFVEKGNNVVVERIPWSFDALQQHLQTFAYHADNHHALVVGLGVALLGSGIYHFSKKSRVLKSVLHPKNETTGKKWDTPLTSGNLHKFTIISSSTLFGTLRYGLKLSATLQYSKLISKFRYWNWTIYALGFFFRYLKKSNAIVDFSNAHDDVLFVLVQLSFYGKIISGVSECLLDAFRCFNIVLSKSGSTKTSNVLTVLKNVFGIVEAIAGACFNLFESTRMYVFTQIVLVWISRLIALNVENEDTMRAISACASMLQFAVDQMDALKMAMKHGSVEMHVLTSFAALSIFVLFAVPGVNWFKVFFSAKFKEEEEKEKVSDFEKYKLAFNEESVKKATKAFKKQFIKQMNVAQ